MTPYRAVPPDARLRQAGPKLTRPTCSGGGAARVKCGWNLRGGSPQLYAFSLMFPVCGGRMLASMSEIDPLADAPLVDWSELSVSGLLPTGTVTLLLADVEGSTRLWETQPGEMTAAMARMNQVVSQTIASHDGVRPVEQGEGDSFVAAFARASDAVAAALELQRGGAGPPPPRRGGATLG